MVMRGEGMNMMTGVDSGTSQAIVRYKTRGAFNALHASMTPCNTLNPLPTNDAPMRHDLCELSISLWEFIWGF